MLWRVAVLGTSEHASDMHTTGFSRAISFYDLPSSFLCSANAVHSLLVNQSERL